MKNISIIMGRGIEGCGVTKFTIEQCKYYDKHGYNYKVYASKDKTWSRTKCHEVSNIGLLRFSNDDQVDNAIKDINESDVAIINSLPPTNLKPEAVDNFKRMISEITVPIVLIQHDHNMISIRRNAGLDEALAAAKVVFAHSTKSDFGIYANEKVGGRVDLFGVNEGTSILPFQPGMYFDEVKERYWKKGCENHLHHKWIGRTTPWKGYPEMFIFHDKYLKPNNLLTTFEGIDRSPALILFRKLYEFKDHVKTKEDPNTYDLSEAYGSLVQVFGPYIHTEMLERMSNVGFGYQLSRMKERFIYRSIEYTHCEVVCTGTIPVFNKKYGDACIHRHYGKPLTECDNSGTIWLDENNFDAAFKQFLEINNDPKKREIMRNQAFEFYKLHQDADYTFKELMNNIKNEL